MKLSKLFKTGFQIIKKGNVFILRIDNEIHEVNISKEHDDELERILSIVDILKKENLTECKKDGISVRKVDSDFDASYIHHQTDITENDRKLKIKHQEHGEELFKSDNRPLHPDIFPDIDSKMYKQKGHKGMHMGPDDTFFTSQLKKDDQPDFTDPAAPFAKYDNIVPGNRRYKGPDPDHAKKPGDFPDKDIF